MSKKRTILIVASHPDDEILGCGATASKLVQYAECFETVRRVNDTI